MGWPDKAVRDGELIAPDLPWAQTRRVKESVHRTLFKAYTVYIDTSFGHVRGCKRFTIRSTCL